MKQFVIHRVLKIRKGEGATKKVAVLIDGILVCVERDKRINSNIDAFYLAI